VTIARQSPVNQSGAAIRIAAKCGDRMRNPSERKRVIATNFRRVAARRLLAGNR